MNERNKIFISYSRQDAQWLNRLQKHIKPYFAEDRQLIWADTAIKTGSLWETEIHDSLKTAKIAVLLVSSNFLASDFVTNVELPRILDDAENKRVTIAWISISASAFKQSPIARYQCLNQPTRPLNMLSDFEQETELAAIAEKLHGLHTRNPQTGAPAMQKQLESAAPITINLEYWSQDLALVHRDCAKRLLRGEPLNETDELHIALELLIAKAI